MSLAEPARTDGQLCTAKGLRSAARTTLRRDVVFLGPPRRLDHPQHTGLRRPVVFGHRTAGSAGGFGVQRAGASLPYTLTMIGGIMVGPIDDRFGILPPLAGCTILMGFGYIVTASAPTLTCLCGRLRSHHRPWQRGKLRAFGGRRLPVVRPAPRPRHLLSHYRQLSFRCGLAADHPALHYRGRLAAGSYRHRHLLHGHDAASRSRAADPDHTRAR